MKLVSKVTEIYCIADDFCKEYNSELNKTSLSLSKPSADSPKHRKRGFEKGFFIIPTHKSLQKSSAT